MNVDCQWILDAIHPFEYDVGSCVPPVFGAYARVFHPAYEIDTPEPHYPVAWKTVAQANNRIAHPAMEWGSLVGSWTLDSQPGLWDRAPDIGRLPVPTTGVLSQILKRHSATETVVYALWNGYGDVDIDMDIKDADVIELPNRPMFALAGSIHAATEPFGIPGRTANLWWAGDRAWCVATDIDLMTTYVGADTRCIQAILSNDALEALPVTADQRITWDADTLNPLPAPPYRLG